MAELPEVPGADRSWIIMPNGDFYIADDAREPSLEARLRQAAKRSRAFRDLLIEAANYIENVSEEY